MDIIKNFFKRKWGIKFIACTMLFSHFVVQNFAQESNVPEKILSPVVGSLVQKIEDATNEPNDVWNFNRPGPNGSDGHDVNAGVGVSDDTEAYDANLQNQSTEDLAKVYSVADNGTVVTLDNYTTMSTYSGFKDWVDNKEWGQFLIRYGTPGKYWFVGYQHLDVSSITNLTTVNKDTPIGLISNTNPISSTWDKHLHVAFYYMGSDGKLVSVHREIIPRDHEELMTRVPSEILFPIEEENVSDWNIEIRQDARGLSGSIDNAIYGISHSSKVGEVTAIANGEIITPNNWNDSKFGLENNSSITAWGWSVDGDGNKTKSQGQLLIAHDAGNGEYWFSAYRYLGGNVDGTGQIPQMEGPVTQGQTLGYVKQGAEFLFFAAYYADENGILHSVSRGNLVESNSSEPPVSNCQTADLTEYIVYNDNTHTPKLPFSDIQSDNPFFNDIWNVKIWELMKGYEDGEFKGRNNLSNGEMAISFYNLVQKSPNWCELQKGFVTYTDTYDDATYEALYANIDLNSPNAADQIASIPIFQEAIRYLHFRGYRLSGNNFMPEERSYTRNNMPLMFCKALGIDLVSSNPNGVNFSDVLFDSGNDRIRAIYTLADPKLSVKAFEAYELSYQGVYEQIITGHTADDDPKKGEYGWNDPYLRQEHSKVLSKGMQFLKGLIVDKLSYIPPANNLRAEIEGNQIVLSWEGQANEIFASASPFRKIATGVNANTYAVSNLPKGHTYGFKVTHSHTNATGEDRFSNEFFITIPDDQGTTNPCLGDNAGEPNETYSQASTDIFPTFSYGDTERYFRGFISSADDNDVIALFSQTSGEITLTLTDLPEDYDLFLLDRWGQENASSENEGTDDEEIIVEQTDTHGENWYVMVKSKNGDYDCSQSYKLNCTWKRILGDGDPCTPNPVHISNVDHNSFNATWNTVSEITGYDNMSDLMFYYTNMSTETTYSQNYVEPGEEVTGLLEGTRYKIEVAFDCGGQFDAKREIGYIETGNTNVLPPSTISATDGTNTEGIQITASVEDNGTVYYQIWKSTDDNIAHAEPLNETWNENPSFFDTDVAIGQQTFYWVRSSEYSDGRYRTSFSTPNGGYRGIKPPVVNAQNNTDADSILITCTSVTGAVAYAFFRAPEDHPTNITRISDWTTQVYYYDKTALPNRNYIYYAKASCTTGESRSSDYSLPNTGSRYSELSSMDFFLSPSGSGIIRIDCSTDTALVEKYTVTKSRKGEDDFQEVVTLTSDKEWCFDGNVEDGVTYEYRIAFLNKTGTVSYSEVKEIEGSSSVSAMNALNLVNVRSLAIDNAGNTYVTGDFYRDYADFDPGAGVYNLPCDDNDVFIAKYSASMDLISVVSLTGPEDDYGYAITLDDQENVYVAGRFEDDLDVDPGTANQYLLGSDRYDGKEGFIVKLDNDFNYIWGKHIGSHGGYLSIYTLPNGKIFLFGSV